MLTPPEQEFVSAVLQSKYIAAAILLAGLWTIESFASMYGGHKRRVAHAAANVGITIINAGVGYAGAFGILFVTLYSQTSGLGIMYQIDMPVVTRWVLAILLFDCWQYWWHRINHVVPLFWRFHSVHHSDMQMDVTSGTRFHTVEIAYSIMARLLVAPLIGITVPQLVLYESMSMLIVMFHHSNIRMPEGLDKSLRWLIVTPWMHWVHHSQIQKETDSNYSSFLSIWDRLFGSFRLRGNPQDIQIGLPGQSDHDWRGLGGMLTYPFRKH